VVGAHGELAVDEEQQGLLDRVHPPDRGPGHRRGGTPDGPRGLRRLRRRGGGGARGRRRRGLHLRARLQVDVDAEEDILRGEAARRQRVARRRRGVRRHLDSSGWWAGDLRGLAGRLGGGRVGSVSVRQAVWEMASDRGGCGESGKLAKVGYSTLAKSGQDGRKRWLLNQKRKKKTGGILEEKDTTLSLGFK